jgi:UDP-N-acetyl-D-glucosamine dehydrogenase
MPRWVVGRVGHALNEDGKALRGAKVLVLGLAYKANIDDDRESPSYELIELLQETGAQVDYCDPFFPHARKGRKHDLELSSVPLSAEVFGRYDAVLVATAHDVFRERDLYRETKLVVDTRNVVAPLFPHGGGPRRVVKA